MRKKIPTLGLIVILLSVTVFFACSKKGANTPLDPSVTTAIIHSSALVDIRASSVNNLRNSIERKIELINRKENFVFDAFNIIYTTNSKKSFSEQVNTKTFNGVLEIRHQGTVIESWTVTNNVFKRVVNQSTTSTVKSNVYAEADPSGGCTISQVHDCVAYKIDDMNAVEYLLCLASAPSCYGGLWAICTYDVCSLNKTYVNPNN